MQTSKHFSLFPVLLGLFLALSSRLSADGQASFYVSPTGTGDLCSLESPCSLTAARDHVRRENDDMAGDITVYLRGGTYQPSEPFELSAEDSGTNEFNITYMAYPEETPILSGGREIIGWTLFDADKNIYRAEVGDLQTRQLYVNGNRAIRARSDENPRGWRKTDTGYVAPDESMASWGNPADIEIVAFWEWKSFRCGIDSIEGRNVTMQQPCWANANIHKEFPINLPTWIENAYELLDSEHEWYLDESEGALYYKPAADEDLSTAEVIAPVLETLVSGVDVKNVEFRGLTFSYATWLHPSSAGGYPSLQAAWHFTEIKAASLASTYLQRTPGNVTFTNPQHMGFYNNTFTHLGGVGLNLDGFAQDNIIERNQFEDISSTGIQLGQIDDPSASVTSIRVLNNVIRNNTITRIGQEYFEGVGIFLGYTDSTLVTHNEIFDVPYSGISVGWGWGQFSYARRNQIAYNRIEKFMQVLRDGGGIYTLSPQPESVIEYNYIRDQKNPFGGLYLDEGSQFFTVQHNVVENVPRWLHIWTDTIRDNTVRFNCTDTREMLNNGLHNTVSDNQVGLTSWPPECQEIIDNVGVEKDS